MFQDRDKILEHMITLTDGNRLTLSATTETLEKLLSVVRKQGPRVFMVTSTEYLPSPATGDLASQADQAEPINLNEAIGTVEVRPLMTATIGIRGKEISAIALEDLTTIMQQGMDSEPAVWITGWTLEGHSQAREVETLTIVAGTRGASPTLSVRFLGEAIRHRVEWKTGKPAFIEGWKVSTIS